MKSATRNALLARLSRYDRVVEVGIGVHDDVARALAAAASPPTTVLATDVHDRPTPPGVEFVRDDITRPTRSVYEGADALYALRLPPELHRPTWDVAREVGATFHFTTLGADPPEVPVGRETLPGTTLFTARERGVVA
ncbi:UPF0146 family protein [Halomarina ordinaria]|uniref:UPF0146 protein ACFQHK_08785 n=1 Tax=Halomarina ordinaria TaxID=3033939 RepID=A0ABD5UBJ2_9EURY|nr:UPF0146 family protein [Halomarina sp. PSRA2]